MANVDGDVKIRVSLDSKGVEKGADRIKNKMQSIAQTVTKTFSATARRKDIEQTIAGYEEQVRAAEKAIRTEQEHIALLKKLRKEVEYDPKARDMVDQMGISDLDTAIDSSYNKIAAIRKEIKGYNTDIKSFNNSMKELPEDTNVAAAAIKKLGDRMNQLARRVFIFNLLRRALESMRKGLANLLSQDSAVAKSMAQIRGSLYAAFMPIYNFVLPAIRSLLNFLAQLASAVANIIGGIFGVSSAALANASALKQQAGATGAAGSAAKKAARQIAAFDEINQMSDESGGGGGGGGGAGGSDWDFSGLDQVSKRMQIIAKLVLSIGAGIAAWKLAKALGALKDASMLRNLFFIAGAATAIWAVFDLLLPNIRSIIDEGPNLENVLGTMSGIFTALSGIAFMSGSVGGGFLWLALGAGALIAKNWDKVSEALKIWDEKITAMVEDVPILGEAYEGVKDIAIAIKDAFTEIASLIVKWSTEGFSVDILGEIGNMSFTSKAIGTLVTWNLINTIAKLIGIKGKVGLGTTAGIVFSLFAIIDIVTDAIEISEGGAADQTEKVKSLILKLLFGAAAAAATAILGGGAKAMMITVPLAMELSLAAANWSDVSKKLGGLAGLLEPIISGFNQLADVITQIATEGMSMDVLANIGNLSFSSTAIVSVVTAGLVKKIGSLIGLRGTIGPKAGVLTMAIGAAIDLGLNVLRIGETEGMDQSDAIFDLIEKVLFGTAAAAITVITGGSAWALLFTVPIAIKLAPVLFPDAASETNFDDQILDVLRAAQSAEELKAALEGVTGIRFSDETFKNLIANNVPEGAENTALALEEMKKQAEAFVGIFKEMSGTEEFEDWIKTITEPTPEIKQAMDAQKDYATTMRIAAENAVAEAQNMAELKTVIEEATGLDLSEDEFIAILKEYGDALAGVNGNMEYAKDGTKNFLLAFADKAATEGLQTWLYSLGLINDEVVVNQDALDDFAAKYKELQTQTEGASTSAESLATSIESMPEVSLDSTGMDEVATTAETLQLDLEDVTTELGNVETAAENVNLVMTDDIGTAFDDMQTDATETGSVMTRVFNVAAFRMKTALQTSMNGIFKSFQSGGSIFQGIETGIERIFKSIMNGLIDGINSILSNSFNKINTALDKIRNTQVDGTKPFIGLPRVSISKIPRLAEGAVIPANREFLAVLGDQKNGTNIEAPLDTIVEAVMIAMARSGMNGGNIAAAVKAAMAGMSIKVGKKEIGHVVADAINSNRRDEGKLALNL